MQIECLCSRCSTRNYFEPLPDSKCFSCNDKLLKHPTDSFLSDGKLNQCPLCGSDHLYKQKDFNRKIGVFILVLGVLGSFYTYGISLLVVTVIDWMLYRYVSEAGICYQCRNVFRKSPEIEKLPGFDLELHDYYRNLVPKSRIT
jgi:hypothetical protein